MCVRCGPRGIGGVGKVLQNHTLVIQRRARAVGLVLRFNLKLNVIYIMRVAAGPSMIKYVLHGEKGGNLFSRKLELVITECMMHSVDSSTKSIVANSGSYLQM